MILKVRWPPLPAAAALSCQGFRQQPDYARFQRQFLSRLLSSSQVTKMEPADESMRGSVGRRTPRDLQYKNSNIYGQDSSQESHSLVCFKWFNFSQSVSQVTQVSLYLSVYHHSVSQSLVKSRQSFFHSFIAGRKIISLFLSEERNHFSLLITLYHAKTKHSLTTLGIQHAHNRRTRIGALRVLWQA